MKKTTKSVHEFLRDIEQWTHEQDRERSVVVFLSERHDGGPEFGCRIGGEGQLMFETLVYTMMNKQEVREFFYSAVAAVEKLLTEEQGDAPKLNTPTLN